MERVAFLVESSGQRIDCLLNPESLLFRRRSGASRARFPSGVFAGGTAADDPVVLSGGGTTTLRLDLLFDVEYHIGPEPLKDVRLHTKPLWDLTEPPGGDNSAGLRVARFVWGKAWNIRGIVTALAERLERFDGAGSPGRSWLRMRFLRIVEPPAPLPADAGIDLLLPSSPPGREPEVLYAGDVREVVTGASAVGEQRPADFEPGLLPELAWKYLGNPADWREIATRNALDDPTHVPPGSRIILPPEGARSATS